MRKNDIISPEVLELLVSRAVREGKFEVERVGKIVDCGITIAEKMVVFRGQLVITVFRAKPMRICDGFAVVTYQMEKYPVDNAEKIIAEVIELRKEWTSGVLE